jgi:hypothetical protein
MEPITKVGGKAVRSMELVSNFILKSNIMTESGETDTNMGRVFSSSLTGVTVRAVFMKTILVDLRSIIGSTRRHTRGIGILIEWKVMG